MYIYCLYRNIKKQIFTYFLKYEMEPHTHSHQGKLEYGIRMKTVN